MTRIASALERHRDRVKNGEEGFTLIELLVVVIIIGILAAIAIPVYIGVQNNAKDSGVKSDLTNAKTAVVAYYTNDSNAAAPDLSSSALKDLGVTDGPDTENLALKNGATSANFCISADSSTGKHFKITNATSVAEGTC